MGLQASVGSPGYHFADLRELLAKALPPLPFDQAIVLGESLSWAALTPATQARVALGDKVGTLLRARVVRCFWANGRA